jgi:hypothetical protein
MDELLKFETEGSIKMAKAFFDKASSVSKRPDCPSESTLSVYTTDDTFMFIDERKEVDKHLHETRCLRCASIILSQKIKNAIFELSTILK